MPFDIGEDWRTCPWYNTCLQCIRIILFLHYIRSVYSCYVFSMHLNIPAKNVWHRGGIVLSKWYIKDENYFASHNTSTLQPFLRFIFINKWLRQSNVNSDFYLKSLDRDIRKTYVNFWEIIEYKGKFPPLALVHDL